MKVILSIEPVRFPLTGIGRYTYELARQLQAHPRLESLQLFGSTGFAPALPALRESAGGGFRLKELVQKSHLANEAYRRLLPLFKQRALRSHEDCLYHGPNFYLPPFGGRRIATFHDLSPFKWPQCAPPQRVRFMQKELALALQRADAFITDSEFTRQELAQHFDIDPARIHAVPLAAGTEFYPRNAQQTLPILARHGLTHGGYSLYVGTIEPRKNLLGLLHAYAQLPPALRQRWPLILTGFRGWRSEEIHQAIERAEGEGWLHYLGFVPAEELPLLFSGARLFCFPSLYEGFGLPVLEAMCSGVPVVCSNSSSLPEVAGDAALQVAPEDTDALSAALQRGLEDEVWRQVAVARGLARGQTFSWERCADGSVAAYQAVMDKR
jgi:alpha-1,3-rhamnosyl/mannosyltransferase